MPRVIAILLVLLAGVASAAPARVVLADPDPELRHAVETALAPWKMSVVVVRAVPHTPGEVDATAAASGARFVVWRDHDLLLVYDREVATTAQRPAQAGALDPVTAATAALTVKTMMRLPDPPASSTVIDRPDGGCNDLGDAGGIGCHRHPSTEVEVDVGLASRFSHGSQDDVGGWLSLAALLRVERLGGLHVGVAAAFGTASDVSRSGFKGTWSDWSVCGVVAYAFERGAWQLTPILGAGVRRVTLSGTEMMTERSDAATLGLVTVGLVGARRFGMWRVGVHLGSEITLGAHTVTKGTGAVTLFEVPGFALVTGVVLGADFGR